MARSDRQKMIDFIASQLPDGEAVLVLASGHDGDIAAQVEVQGDDLAIKSNCPEWVTIHEVCRTEIGVTSPPGRGRHGEGGRSRHEYQTEWVHGD